MASRPKRSRGSPVANKDNGESDHLRITEVYRQNLAANLRRLRKRDGLTQYQLAKIINGSQGHVTMIETGKLNIGLRALTRIALVFNMKPTELLDPPPSDEPQPAVDSNVSFVASGHEQRGGLPSDPCDPSSAGVQVPEMEHESSKTIESEPAGSVNATFTSPETAQLEVAADFAGNALNLSTIKRVVEALYQRVDALERRYGPVPFSRAMLNTLLITALNASQELEEDKK